MRRRFEKPDGNAAMFREFFSDVGVEFWDIGDPFDFLIAWRGKLMIADAKMPKTGRWTKKQQKELPRFARMGVPVYRLETLQDAADMLGVVIVPTRDEAARN